MRNTLPRNKNFGPLEVAATVCSAFAYYEPGSGFTRDDLREQAPNRYRWAEAPDPIDKRLPASDTYDDTRRDPASNETRPLIIESSESLGRDSRRHARREPNVSAYTQLNHPKTVGERRPTETEGFVWRNTGLLL